MKKVPRALVPLAVTGLGLAALMASWSCLPAIPLQQSTIVFRPTATPGPAVVPRPVSPSPVASESATPAAPGSPTVLPSGGLAPRPDRTYSFTVTGTGMPLTAGTYDITVTAVDGDAVTYNLTSRPGGASSTMQQNLHVTRDRGIFWVFNSQNPLAADISSYPIESVTVPAGTFEAFKVSTADGFTYWFADGVEVKATGPSGMTVLTRYN